MLTFTVIGNASGTRYVSQKVDSYEKAYHGIRLIVAGITRTNPDGLSILDNDVYRMRDGELVEAGFRFEIWED